MIVSSGTARIAVDDRGDGPATPALLIHAGVTDKRSWSPLIDLLSPGRRCIAYDSRGFGETTATVEDVSLTGDAIAVLDACGVDGAVVVAASMGGRTAIDLALAHPDRVNALVLMARASPARRESRSPRPSRSGYSSPSRRPNRSTT